MEKDNREGIKRTYWDMMYLFDDGKILKIVVEEVKKGGKIIAPPEPPVSGPHPQALPEGGARGGLRTPGASLSKITIPQEEGVVKGRSEHVFTG